MFSHNYSAFANSCVRTPLHGSTKLPNPSYLKPKCKNAGRGKSGLKKCKQNSSDLSLNTENNNFMSLKDFYESIPDYDDVHHLSQFDFYKEIDTLKRKQTELRSTCFHDDSNRGVWSRVETHEPVETPDSNFEKFVSSKHFNEFKVNAEKVEKRKGSAKSVRIESSDHPYITPHDDNSTRIFKKSLRSQSASPNRRSPTAIKPRMKDTEELENLISASKSFSTERIAEKSSPKGKVSEIPITSKIPLFKQIMEDQEHRSSLAKLDSAIELNAKIKPFGFDNGPDRPHSRCLSRSLSTPMIHTPETLKTPKPKEQEKKAGNDDKTNQGSNYHYTRMLEEEYFRNLKRRVRAEELLKMSSLPQSMKRRESKKIEQHSCVNQAKKTKKKRKPKKRKSREDFITTLPDPYDLETTKRFGEKPKHLHPTPTPTNSTQSYKSFAPKPLYPVNRPNLAATLRFEHSRNKLRELSERADSSMSGTVKSFQWGVKKMPGWQSLSYDPSHAEELKLRLATRRAEQRLRQEEYKMTKELMIERVKAAPLLLEGPTQWGPKVGQMSHHCGGLQLEAPRKTKRERKRPGSSKLSMYTDRKTCSFHVKHDSIFDGKNSSEFMDGYESSEIEEHVL